LGDRYSQEEGEDCSSGFAFGRFGWGVGLSGLISPNGLTLGYCIKYSGEQSKTLYANRQNDPRLMFIVFAILLLTIVLPATSPNCFRKPLC
jgi:hypothetical protein